MLLLTLILLYFNNSRSLNINSFNKRSNLNVKNNLEKNLLSKLKDVKGRGNLDIDLVTNEIESIIEELEESKGSLKDPIRQIKTLNGIWKLLYTSSPKTNSPIQRTITSYDSLSVYQNVDLLNKNCISNVVCLSEKARLRVSATISTVDYRTFEPRIGDG